MSEGGIRWTLVLLLALEAILAISGVLVLMPWLVAGMSVVTALVVIATPLLGALAAIATGIAIAVLATFEPGLQVVLASAGLAIAVLGYELYRVRGRVVGIRPA